ncbi:SDR family oxidoreductase [Panacibacter ginsenosidivorans]|uniref:SDR family oxidoreductase n=1 Tax=Panacibacter ginsenosidivorans TaxID=1813871 RepID=A0A5B8VDX5_9BACT|nr:SDR family oxidoreductase [Panacibacter ginsenosidivorans]QEC69620.1 SDR family oxidoreductase [Panacibacter ginsenosidivorans]
MSQKLKNKVAIVTGGSSGIGLATAKLFALEGAKVIITGRNQQNLDQALTEIGNAAIAVKGDVANLADIDSLYATIHEKFDKADVLVVNAAVYVLAPLPVFTEAMFDKVTDINFKGAFFTVQKALPYLNDGASIILLSSTVNEKGFPNHAAYAASKAAVRSLARSFSAELLDRKIRVNVITPGPVDTPIFDSITDTKEDAKAVAANMGNFTPVKRIGKPEEIASAALYLASEDSSFMIGAEMLLDGGIRSL